MPQKLFRAGLDAPDFTSTCFFTAVFKRPPLHTLSGEGAAEEQPPVLPAGLAKNEIVIRELIKENNRITVNGISERLGETERRSSVHSKPLLKEASLREVVQKWRFIGSRLILPNPKIVVCAWQFNVVQKNVTKMSPKCHQNVTKMSPKCHQNVTKMSPKNRDTFWMPVSSTPYCAGLR